MKNNKNLLRVFENIDTDSIRGLGDYENITVVDKNGIVVFYDYADINQMELLSIPPEKVIGNKITEAWAELDDNNSTLMTVLRTGKPILNNKQIHKTKKDRTVYTYNSIFPIIADGEVVGAVEFSRYYFNKEDIKLIENNSPHRMFRKNNTAYTIDNIQSNNKTMINIKERIHRTSKTDSPVLIYGETGTGKELIAQSIHNLSSRYRKQYVSVNCSAIPATLFESLMFGTVKGSFTGSDNTTGLFEEANGGTLFLDEINSLDIVLQSKLLKAIEEKMIRKVGGNKYIPIDIRVMAATNEEPEILIEEGRLREDLFYRIGVVQIDLPPLRERKDDISLLVDNFIKFYNKKMNVSITETDKEVFDKLYEYNWPGNVRELKNVIESAYNNVTSSVITLEDIPRRIRFYKDKSSTNEDITDNRLNIMVDEYEKQLIMKELAKSGNKKIEAARNLGISKQLLNFKINKYNIG
ncbi:MAG: sigma 54-interacting transcriptional regulator [Tissierella sp.]|nr:sigma 54-interacting transcriptional regulator [Tissierella sp.]